MPYALLVAAVVAAGPSARTLPDRYMPVDQVKPGMKGIGKTVLKGTAIVEFDVEVIGVLKNIFAKMDLILIRCSGQGLEKTGVISGMSGSPIYIGGKMIGALAYSWRFQKSPIAGVMPIESMLGIGSAAAGGAGEGGGEKPPTTRPAGTVHRLSPPIQVDGRTYGQVRVEPRAPLRSGGSTSSPRPDAGGPVLSPIVAPVMVSGVRAEALKRLKPFFARFGCMPVQTGAVKPGALHSLNARLEPGAVCAVSLVTGDMTYTVVGTVTDRVGDMVLAFGHAFFGEGETEMLLQTGAVLAVMPSQMGSFKFGVPLKAVGRITGDEMTGIRGEVGPLARMIPFQTRVRPASGPAADYHLRVMRHREYTPVLIRDALYEAIYAHAAPPVDSTISFDATLTFAGQAPVELGNIYTGSAGAYEAIRLVSMTAAMLLSNDIQPVDLERGRVAVTVEKGRKSAYIESVRLDTPKVKPGEAVSVRAVLVPYQADREIIRLGLTVPKGTPEGTYALTICDARTAGRIDLGARPHRLEPRTLDDLFSLARERLDNRKAYARLQLKDGGVAVEGRELPRLPNFALGVFGGSRWTGAVTPVRRVIGSDAATSWVVTGSQQVRFEVSEKP